MSSLNALLEDPTVLRAVAEHVALPPKLPQSELEDDGEGAVERAICALAVASAQGFASELLIEQRGVWERMAKTIETLALILDEKETTNISLLTVLQEMKEGDVVAIHVRAQNAAVVVRKQGKYTLFEQFEVQPPNAEIMGCTGKLRRVFPNSAVRVQNTLMDEEGFLEQVAAVLVSLDAHVFEDAVAVARKAGRDHEEVRDSMHPKYISEFFMGILHGYGESAQVRTVTKRTAEDVLWKSALKPWKRSPIWLIIRVVLQTSMTDHITYKLFMVYLHATLLRLCTQHDLPSELLFAIRAKMARRLHKLDSIDPPSFLTTLSLDTAQATHDLLQKRWDAVREEDRLVNTMEWNPETLDVMADTIHRLENSGEYLRDVLQQHVPPSDPKPFDPPSLPRHVSTDFCDYADEKLEQAITKYGHIALMDFELAVQKHLDSWQSGQTGNRETRERACEVLEACIDQYRRATMTHYSVDMADHSISILTILDLWVAIDKIAIIDTPLLGNYSPDVPSNFLDPLLLHTRVHVDRANFIECYLRGRHNQVPAGQSMFSDTVDARMFAIRYFNASDNLQSLREEIEADAQDERDKRVAELDKNNAKYHRLVAEAARMSCDLTWSTYHREYEHYSWKCTKCQRKQEAANLASAGISVHEWPLPEEDRLARRAVFELRAPVCIQLWRSATYMILCDIGLPSLHASESSPAVQLQQYQELQRYAQFHPRNRVSIASTTNSFSRTHYSRHDIPTTRDVICKPNGLRYRGWDHTSSRWIADSFTGSSTSSYGTFQLPTGSPYRYLQYAVTSTEHTTNQVIADRSGCPRDMNLVEHDAFGELRSGARLQWLNILRELEDSALTFRREEIHTLLAQAAWQVGDLHEDGKLRIWHEELEARTFIKSLLNSCWKMLTNVRANWMESVTVRTLVLLVLRALISITATTSSDLRDEIFLFLREARTIAFGWLKDVQRIMKDSMDGDDSTAYGHLVCEMAITCRMTYDVDRDDTSGVLASPEDISMCLESAIALQQNLPPKSSQASVHLQILLGRDRRNAHKLQDALRTAIIESNWSGFHKALCNVWKSYEPGDLSEVLQDNRWIHVLTLARAQHASQRVHYDTIEGTLLFDGKPLGRLPRDYVTNSTYTRTFGARIFDVIPGANGMEYSTPTAIQKGHMISFSLTEGLLRIQATSEDGHQHELVPHEKIRGDFPLPLINDCAHWINFHNKTMEFRPLDSQWSSNDENWVLDLRSPITYRVIRTYKTIAQRLVDVHRNNATFHLLARRLASLEEAQHIIVAYHEDDSHTVTASLPRLRLCFSLREDHHLHCDAFPHMVVDSFQSCDTLIGLRNKLVLRGLYDKDRNMRLSRSVLVPYGRVGVQERGHHVAVTIETSGLPSVTWMKYDLDQDLGRLFAESSMTSRLFKIYLHAITSHTLPDPLTLRTGVEQALVELSSGVMHSFMSLEDTDVNLLGAIGSLTPKRSYYPDHLTSMQTVDWSPMSALAQHAAFAPFSRDILGYAMKLETLGLPFPNDIKPVHDQLERQMSLLHRAACRSQVLYPSGTGHEPSILNVFRPLFQDQHYVSRGSAPAATDFEAVCCAVMVSQTRSNAIDFPLKSRILDHCDEQMAGPMGSLKLGYSQSWLKPNLATSWLSMYRLARQVGREGSSGHHHLTFSLATTAYRSPSLRDLLPVLVAISCNQSLASVDPPAWALYELHRGYERSEAQVKRLVKQHQHMLTSTPANDLRPHHHESPAQHDRRKDTFHRDSVEEVSSVLASLLIGQTPGRLGVPDSAYFSSWFNLHSTYEDVSKYLTDCDHNTELRTHLEHVQRVLQTGTRPLTNLNPDVHHDLLELQEPTANTMLSVYPGIATIHNLLQTPSVLLTLSNPSISLDSVEEDLCCEVDQRSPARDTSALNDIVEELRGDKDDGIRRLYGEELRQSVIALEQAAIGVGAPTRRTSEQLLRLASSLRDVSRRCKEELTRQVQELHRRCRLARNHGIQRVLDLACLSPRTTVSAILAMASLDRREPATNPMLQAVSQTLVLFQHLERLRKWLVLDSMVEFAKELANWRTDFGKEKQDHLLLQIDGDFRVRSHQIRVAQEMISPRSKESTAQQLNMGEGKSSVIVPMIVTDIANGTTLMRVVVLKSLSKQMFHLLATRIGGMVNRRVYYLPFSRQSNLKGGALQTLEAMYQECTKLGGVLLAQPEHILSLKLLTIDTCISTLQDTALKTTAIDLQRVQKWLKEHARDCLDESDELLSCQYQLIYTWGTQQHLDDSPDRWTTIQQVLSLVKKHMPKISSNYPHEVEYIERRSGQFPTIRLLQTPPGHRGAWVKLRQKLAEDVLASRLANLNLAFISSPQDLASVLNFMIHHDVSQEDCDSVSRLCAGVWKGVLLVRGLLALDVLQHVLTDKRYRVNYGLDLKRSLLAVPYAAKDIPTIRSEFSHPDVAIALTALSYYYTGLTSDQLTTCFNSLARSDDPGSEYERWVCRDSSTPEELQRLNGVNTKDVKQFRDMVYPLFASNEATVDFFLAKVVFPKEAKEFPCKLSTSGWDLAERRSNLTTGFSGTNDRKHLLPTSIEQRDLPEQLGTNALVLSYLLQSENNAYQCMLDRLSTSSDQGAKHFLAKLTQEDPDIRMLIDAGAQMLDLRNHELAAEWLDLASSAVAAVYFNDGDELTVLSRDGRTEAFQSSPYKHIMDKVIVYLDDAHTRGTDLKLPRNTRAAVTLGPKLTKDRLVQACMRMRQLGQGQSVKFFAPPECDAQIRAASPFPHHIGTRDILRWAMQESCKQIRHYVPHWAQQGLEYNRHRTGEATFAQNDDLQVLSQTWLTPEGRTLDDMYGMRDGSVDIFSEAYRNDAMRIRLDKLAVVSLHDPRLDEEQEREISHEIERERHVERPPKAQPVMPTVHNDVREFIRTGSIPPGSRAFRSMMLPIRVPQSEANVWSPNLLATREYHRTVLEPGDSEEANFSLYARGLRWIGSSWSATGITVVAFSPFEVDELLPLIRTTGKVHLHLYTPKVVQSMRSFSDLTFYVVPSLPRRWRGPSLGLQSQLNIFAGQLYFDDYDATLEFCAFLGVFSPESEMLYGAQNIERGSDGFIDPTLRPSTSHLSSALVDYEQRSFHTSIISSLKKHISMRRNGMDFFRTHVGQILHGRQITEDTFPQL